MDKAIIKAIQMITQNIDPDKIILFGSRISTPDEDSDYDLCILKNDIKHKRRLAQRIYKLLYHTKLAFDIIVDTPEHFNEMKKEPSYIYSEIERTGKVIYEKKMIS